MNEKKPKNTTIEYTQVVWEITSLLQKAESLEEALRTSLGEVVKAVVALFALIVNLIALRKIKRLNLTNVSGN